jgi:hypothetical protein
MPEYFEIDVPVRNTIRVFEAAIQKNPDSYRIIVSIEGRDIMFEAGEDKNFRPKAKKEKYKEALSEIIEATARVLTELYRSDKLNG